MLIKIYLIILAIMLIALITLAIIYNKKKKGKINNLNDNDNK